MNRTQLFKKKKGKRRHPNAWFNVVIDWTNYRVNIGIGPVDPTSRLAGEVPALYPYPIDGTPYSFGDLEGPFVYDPAVTDGFEPNGINLTSIDSFPTAWKEKVSFTTYGTGEEAVETLLSTPGPSNSVDSYGGGADYFNKSNLLVIYVDELDPVYGYDDDRQVVHMCELYYVVSWRPVARENDGLPAKFKVTGYVMEGTNQLTGMCLPRGMQSFHRFYVDRHGNPCQRDGSPIPGPATAEQVYMPVLNPGL